MDEATSDILPSSPGLESLIEEKRVESNRLKKAEKFNEAWEAIRVCAESCARQSTPVFRENLEVLKTFSQLMKQGIPEDVKTAILKYAEKEVSDEEPERESDVQTPVVKAKFHEELPLEHRPYVENLGDYVIVRVRGDGACMFNAVAASIYGSDKHSWVLRSLVHSFIVENWDFYCHYYRVPFQEDVGVGGRQQIFLNSISDVWQFSMNPHRPKAYVVNISTLQALQAFLLIPDSHRLWSTNNVSCLKLNRFIAVLSGGAGGHSAGSPISDQCSELQSPRSMVEELQY